MIFSEHSCSSVTFAQHIILRMSCFISRTGDTNKLVAMFSCPNESTLNQAPILVAYNEHCFQWLFTYCITKFSSGTMCQGLKESFSSFLSPCSGRSKLKTCHPCGQIFSAKNEASSLFLLDHEHKDIIGSRHYPKELLGYYQWMLIVLSFHSSFALSRIVKKLILLVF